MDLGILYEEAVKEYDFGLGHPFRGDRRVLFIDLHQNPRTLYPGTGFVHQIGSGNGKSFTVNIPMPVNAGYDAYQLVFESIVQPMNQEFQPQIIVRNGGSDPHFNDSLTSLGLSVKGFRMIGEKVREIASSCDDKAIDLIASGYNEKVLPYAWLALISGLVGIELQIEEPDPNDLIFGETERVMDGVRNNLKDYWTCLR